MSSPRINSIALVAVILFLFAEIALLFFTPRSETVQLLTVYFALCGAYLVLYQEVKSIQTAAFLGVLFRGIAWVAFPNLSDDLYRFIWDGAVILEGVSPYAFTPVEFFKTSIHAPFDTLYPLINSPEYHSVYPPIIQMISSFGALASNDLYLSSLVIKLPLFLAEIGTIWMLPKLLMDLNISPKYSVLYILNPLIIVDVLGNAHFEALMICLVLVCIRQLIDRQYILAGVFLALAVGTKLIPLLLLPFLLKALRRRERLQFLLAFGPVTVLLFLPVYYDVSYLYHFVESIDLYFQRFEFNASFYYLFKALGTWMMGYNPIQTLGPLLSFVTLGMAAWFWLRQPKYDILAALRAGLWTCTVYYLFATTVHPWYISFLVLLGLFSRRSYPMIWSVLVFFSYTAYQTDFYEENYFLVLLEYGLLGLAIAYPKFTRRLIISPIRRL